VAGNAIKTIDGEGNQTTFNYTDRFGDPDAEAQANSGPIELGTQLSYAFPSLVTNAMGHTAYTQRDYHTGLVVDAEDPNGVTSSAYYDDALDRTTQVIRASNDPALKSQMTFSYDDTARIITATSDLSAFGDNLLKTQTLYDGMGRTIELRQYETATAYIMTKQTHDALGRVNKVSNPYRTGQTLWWTSTAYDALGRIISATGPDNGVITKAYSGNTVTVTDQAGKDRQSTTDALGRLIKVVEDPGGLGYVTDYAYDVLGNLKTVTQGTQTRTFIYDSLSRLVTAVNPESGTIQYKYDANGNLVLKIDPRPGGASLPNCPIPYSGTNIATCYEYDALNRVTKKDYGDTTPDVRYYYDAQTLPVGAPSFVRGASKGRLVAVTTGGTNAGTYYGYSGVGQVLRRIQRTDSINYLSEATYNSAGATLTETYPTVPGHTNRRTINYSYDGAGRLFELTTAATTYSAAGAANVGSVTYAPHGDLAGETLGNNLVHGVTYNNRLQTSQIKLGTSAAPTSVLNLTYNYGTTSNNGNVVDITHKIGTWTTKQNYTYDSLNRLNVTSETNGSTTTYWTEDNDYDRFGNRWEVIAGTPPVTFNSKNQISGHTYDLAGNVTDDTVHDYTYDAENRVKTVDGVANTFVYDGEGRRVKKYFPSGEQVRLVYGVGGRLLMEFSTANGALQKEYVYGAAGLLAVIEPAGGTKYVTPDHLGSPRVLTGDTGGVVSRHDYKPFGSELTDGDGPRTTALFFGMSVGLKQKFTQKERNVETGLDYFEARYYSSAYGRFTGPDLAGPDLGNPQTLNRYQYCLNNPLRYVDPDGLYNRDVHFDLTYLLGLAAGLPEDMAMRIAAANQRTDEERDKQPMPTLFPPSTGRERRMLYHFTTPERRAELWNRFEETGSPEDLGVFLHTQQDSFSHAGLDPVWGQLSFDWPWRWNDADDTWRDPDKADVMAEETYNYLICGSHIMLQKGTIKSLLPPMPWSMLRPYVSDFNRAQTEDEKRYILTVLRGRIMAWRQEQEKRKALNRANKQNKYKEKKLGRSG
jgi:RHS repeat-associated protein